MLRTIYTAWLLVFATQAIAHTTANEDFILLPEQAVSVSSDQHTTAFYAKPTSKYVHGILGDAVEAEQLIVRVGDKVYQHTLPDNEVFEDIRPRLFDVDGDGDLEFITIRSQLGQGAGIAIYALRGDKLSEFAHVPPIGKQNRWLNIAAIDDLDNDGTVEIAWVQTPHIGGILKVARIHAGELTPLTSVRHYSNHTIGERNLCLSVLMKNDRQQKILYVPTQSRDAIVGFRFADDQWRQVDMISLAVDFSQPLAQQHTFQHSIAQNANCIF